jgi:membrane associated rhomboid family serine protease
MANFNFRSGGLDLLPEVVKNLLIINGLFFLATYVAGNRFGIDLNQILGLHFPGSTNFKPYQIITYMFMHGNLTHLIMNMFALWMFGRNIENYWGGKRFLIYYMVTGLGAALIHYIVLYLSDLLPALNEIDRLHAAGAINDIDTYRTVLFDNVPPVVGASGAVFGILLAFGMMFPDQMIYLYFAIPIKAKYFVILYGLIELSAGIYNSEADHVAHFAHLGGMLFGFLLIKYWQRNRYRYQ